MINGSINEKDENVFELVSYWELKQVNIKKKTTPVSKRLEIEVTID